MCIHSLHFCPLLFESSDGLNSFPLLVVVLSVPFLFAWCHKAIPWFPREWMPRVIHGAGQCQDVCTNPGAHLPFPVTKDPLRLECKPLEGDWPGEMAKTWDYEPVQRADQAVHANIPEEGAPGATEGADCGCQIFSCYKHSPATPILKGSLSLPFLPFHCFKNTEADSPNV